MKSFKPSVDELTFRHAYESTAGEANLFYKSLAQAVYANKPIDWCSQNTIRVMIAEKFQQLSGAGDKVIAKYGFNQHADLGSTVAGSVPHIVGAAADTQDAIDHLTSTERESLCGALVGLYWDDWDDLEKPAKDAEVAPPACKAKPADTTTSGSDTKAGGTSANKAGTNNGKGKNKTTPPPKP